MLVFICIFVCPLEANIINNLSYKKEGEEGRQAGWPGPG